MVLYEGPPGCPILLCPVCGLAMRIDDKVRKVADLKNAQMTVATCPDKDCGFTEYHDPIDLFSKRGKKKRGADGPA